jgi:hypothetical protein
MTYRGHVKNGTIVLEGAAALPEGAEVEVTLRNPRPAEGSPDATPTLYEQLESVVGKAKDLPADLAENHDHYLSGRPKP